MNNMKLWNNYELTRDESAKGLKIFMPYGEWPWNEKITQRFGRVEAEAIANALKGDIDAGEPGIPVYQGHPDVPELAAKYPDKGALGWVKSLEVTDSGVLMSVEWDRWPGKGFAWFSPYWSGNAEERDGKVIVTVDAIRSIGLVNRPNIHDFRLPNEELEAAIEETNMKEVLQALDLANDATAKEAVEKIDNLKKEVETCAADKAKAEADKSALEKECESQKLANEELQKKLEEATANLANALKESADTKTALANEKAEVEKLKSLKTESVTKDLPNEKHETDNRMTLVNELMLKHSIDFDAAWCLAKEQKPDLFK